MKQILNDTYSKYKKQMVKDAFKSGELEHTLQNISCDDNKEIEDYTQEELVHEAKYVLSCFYEGGHINNEALTGESPDDYYNIAWAKREIKYLNKFISKYSVQ